MHTYIASYYIYSSIHNKISNRMHELIPRFESFNLLITNYLLQANLTKLMNEKNKLYYLLDLFKFNNYDAYIYSELLYIYMSYCKVQQRLRRLCEQTNKTNKVICESMMNYCNKVQQRLSHDLQSPNCPLVKDVKP